MRMSLGGYVERCKRLGKRFGNPSKSMNVFIVKNRICKELKGMGVIYFHTIYFPRDMIGKKVRFKVEVVE